MDTRTPYADTCVECLAHVVTPVIQVREGGEEHCLYQCPCGASWSCRWSTRAVEGWDAL